jgi:hypothetical protein
MIHLVARALRFLMLALILGGCATGPPPPPPPPTTVWIPPHWVAGPYGYHWVPGHYRWIP